MPWKTATINGTTILATMNHTNGQVLLAHLSYTCSITANCPRHSCYFSLLLHWLGGHFETSPSPAPSPSTKDPRATVLATGFVTLSTCLVVATRKFENLTRYKPPTCLPKDFQPPLPQRYSIWNGCDCCRGYHCVGHFQVTRLRPRPDSGPKACSGPKPGSGPRPSPPKGFQPAGSDLSGPDCCWLHSNHYLVAPCFAMKPMMCCPASCLLPVGHPAIVHSAISHHGFLCCVGNLHCRVIQHQGI